MKLTEVRVAQVDRAIEVYLDHAYARGEGRGKAPSHDLPANASPEDVLALFHREERDADGAAGCVRYTMRLGNRNYPFMKLVLQEHIVEGEYFFAVDTHDHLDIKPDYPDYEAWQAVKRFNDELKREIEGAFADNAIPTASCIRDAIAGRSPAEVDERGQTILVVDDEEHLQQAVVGLLQARGYRTLTASDGAEAVDLARRELPDLMVLDYELPEMDGLEVLLALRQEPGTCDIPVLLCTASRISVEDIGKADGFLAKPFQEGLLNEMVERLLANAPAERGGGAA